MKIVQLLLLSLSLVAITHSAVANSLPPDFSASYVVKKGFVTIGKAKRQLNSSEDKLTYTSDSKTTGMIGALFKEHIIQKTEFLIENNQVRPEEYRYNRNKGKKKVHQIYQWNKQTVISKRGDTVSEYEIPVGTQDQNSYQLALMIDLASGKRNFTYHIAENVRLVQYDVRYLKNKTIDTKLGKLKTVVVQVKTRKMQTTIWCAPSLHYLPVKIEHIEDGTSFTASLKSLSGMTI